MISKLIGLINSPSSEAFSTHFLNGATTLPGPALTALRKRSRVDYVQVLIVHKRHHEEKDTRLIPADTVAAIQEFVPVKSSVSVIHYLSQEDDKCACEEHTGTSLSRIYCTSHWWLNVSNRHGSRDAVVAYSSPLARDLGRAQQVLRQSGGTVRRGRDVGLHRREGAHVHQLQEIPRHFASRGTFEWFNAY